MTEPRTGTGVGPESPVVPVTACILAGGLGVRIGGDKCGKVLGARRLIDYALEASRRLAESGRVARVVVAGGGNDVDAGDAVILTDLAGAGPIAGLHACLVRYGRTLLIPCDMPFLGATFLAFLLERSRHHGITVCRVGGLVQPQVGVYSEACLGTLEEMIGQGRYSLFRLVEECGLPVLVLEEPELAGFGEPGLLFLNINTGEELRRAEESLFDRGPQEERSR